MVIIRVVTFLNTLKCRWSLAWHQYRSAIKKELLHLPKIDFSEEKCHGKCLEERFSASRFQNFLGACVRRSKPASSCSEVWLRPWCIMTLICTSVQFLPSDRL